MTRHLDSWVRDVLAQSRVDGHVVVLPRQLPREDYVKVDKALRAIGGKWDRKARGHVFPFDPRELVTTAVEAGTVVDRKQALQFFETPVSLGKRLASVVNTGDVVLEPSAGLGALVRQCFDAGAAHLTAIDIDATHAGTLRQLSPPPGAALSVVQADFLAVVDRLAPLYDAVVMNPPFSNNQDAAHIQAAWRVVRPGGTLAALACEGLFFRQDRTATAFREWLAAIGAAVDAIPSGTFTDTGVATRLIVAEKEA